MYFIPEMLADFHRNVTLWFPMEEAKGAVGRSTCSGEKQDFIHHAPAFPSRGQGSNFPTARKHFMFSRAFFFFLTLTGVGWRGGEKMQTTVIEQQLNK